MKERKQKTLAKRLLVAMLSVMMAVTFIPTSLFAYAAEPEVAPDDVQKDAQTEVVQDEPTDTVQKDEPQTEATKAVKEEATKATEAQKKQEAKEDESNKTQYFKDLKTVRVDVSTEKDAFAEKVKLVVEPLEEDSDAFKDAEKALAKSEQVYSGILAYDIHFENGDGEEVEPQGAVSVEMKAKAEGLKDIAAEDFNADSVQVIHIVDKKAEVVADTNDKNKIDGTVDASKTEKVVESIEASFEVDSFSSYVITWEGAVEGATIHWGIDEEDGFKELATPTTIDSAASSIDINIIIDAEKYYFIGADYKLAEDAEEFENLKSTVLHNTDDGWTASLEDSGTVKLADGSHIYVHYAPYTEGHPYVPPESPGADVLAPETTKTVTDNENGTFNIRLDVLGKADHSQVKKGANVIVIMDITQSMTNSMSGGSTRMAAAKGALSTLISTLDPDTNLINFRAINFGDNAYPYDYDATTVNKRGVNWTTDKDVMQAYADGLPNNPNDMGTCWQAGLRGGYNIVNDEVKSDSDLKNNPTYVVFVTDGNPNCYSANNDGTGRWTGASGPNYNATAYNRAAYWANLLGPACNFYGVYCGNSTDDGLGYLRSLISAANGGDDSKFINGTSQDAINSAFAGIAETVINNLGAGEVTVDDGIPTLSNVSANVSAGEARGFKYYIKPALGTESEWEEAPGASYSQTNGVTWDLGEAGELQNGWIYSLEFTVWPSQAAYDLIADLNNGIIKWKDLTDEQKATVDGNEESGYTLKTNTHLYTTFTDLNGKTYKEINDETPKAMELPTETISVEKLWNNFLDSRTDTDIDGLQLVLNRDNEEYLEFDVSSPSWKKEGIYISCGQIVDGVIKEVGHDYYVTEKPKEQNDKTDYWEVNSPKYHPMVVDGEMQLFVQDDTVDSPAFEENGHKYRAATQTEQNLTAINERTSWLNLTKVVNDKTTEKKADPDQLFEYKVKITEPVSEGSETPNVFFSVFGDTNYMPGVETTATEWLEESTGRTYYYAPSGTEFTLKIKAGWSVRFLNLATGTDYKIEEINIPDGYALDNSPDAVTAVETLYIGRDGSGRIPAEGYPKTTTSKTASITGKINQNNTDYSVTYTNKYEETSIGVKKVWDDAEDQDGKRSSVDFDFVLFARVGNTIAEVGRVNVSDLENLTKIWENLPVYKNGIAVVYSVVEELVPGSGYTTDTPEAVEVQNGSTTNITNSYTPEQTKLLVEKVWKDNTGKEMDWPEDLSVTVQLTADGNAVSGKTATLNEDNTSYTFEELDKYKKGQETPIEYGVAEVEVSGYTADIGDPEEIEGGYKITITNTPNTGTLKITKELGEDSEEVTIPADTTFVISGPDDYNNGEDNTITYADFTDGEYTESGVPTGTYTVTETNGTGNVTGYTLTVAYDPQSGSLTKDATLTLAVENTYTRDTGSLKITKTIQGLPEAEIPANLSFTIKGPADYGTNGEKTVTYADDFTDGVYTEDPVPTGKYTVTESNAEVPGYMLETVINPTGEVELTKGGNVEFTVTNTYTHVNVEIDKTIDKLVSFDENEEVKNITFTFRVVGKAGNVTKLNTIVAVEFNAKTGTTSKATIEKIPADITQVTVTEIDSGNYQSAEIELDEPITEANYTKTFKFKFNNTQNDDDYESGAINKYKKSATGYVKDGGQE